jgi:hypothetical protein
MDTLKESLRIFYVLKSSSEEEEFRFKTKLNVLRFLPSVGYDAFRQSPMVTLNTSSLYGAINDKRERKAKVSSIQKINEVQYNLDLSDIISLYAGLKRKIDFYNNQVRILELESKRFEITKRTYTNKELLPSEFLAKEIDHYNFLNTITQLELDIFELRDAILNKSKKAPYERLF